MQFSDTTNRTGIVELLEDLTNTQSASTSSYALAKKTRDINNAFAQFVMLAIRASGGQFDDTNQTDYNIIKLNIVSGQQDYPLTVDGSSTPNQILDIDRIELGGPSGTFNRLPSFDEMGKDYSLVQQSTVSGTPSCHYKLANGIFLDKKPNYNLTNGIYIYIGRTPVYFLTSDTVKKPGIPDHFSEYLAYRPAYLYCSSKGKDMAIQARNYLAFLTKMETDIGLYYTGRNRDEKKRMVARVESNK